MKTKFNALYWLIILIIFDIVLIKGLITKDMLNYLNPKMFPFVYFSIIVFTLLIINQIRLITHQRFKLQKLKLGYLMYIIPLTIALIGPNPTAADMATNRTVDLGIKPIENQTKKEEITTSDEYDTPKDIIEQDNYEQEEAFQEEIPQHTTDPDVISDPYNMPTNTFLSKVTTAHDNLEEYIGVEMTLKGFVFKSDNLEKNQFIIARLWINCCAADAGVVGMVIESDQASTLKVDDWIEVTGSISQFEYIDKETDAHYSFPLLKNPQIQKVPALESPYVYE